MLALIGTLSVLLLVVWHHRNVKRWALRRGTTADALLRPASAKSNNDGECSPDSSPSAGSASAAVTAAAGGSGDVGAIPTRFHNPLFHTDRNDVGSRRVDTGGASRIGGGNGGGGSNTDGVGDGNKCLEDASSCVAAAAAELLEFDLEKYEKSPRRPLRFHSAVVDLKNLTPNSGSHLDGGGGRCMHHHHHHHHHHPPVNSSQQQQQQPLLQPRQQQTLQQPPNRTARIKDINVEISRTRLKATTVELDAAV